jgi:hypothetical protein
MHDSGEGVCQLGKGDSHSTCLPLKRL